jgi:hypothetical protein
METQGNRSTTLNDKIRTAIFVLIVSTIICVSSLIDCRRFAIKKRTELCTPPNYLLARSR